MNTPQMDYDYDFDEENKYEVSKGGYYTIRSSGGWRIIELDKGEKVEFEILPLQ